MVPLTLGQSIWSGVGVGVADAEVEDGPPVVEDGAITAVASAALIGKSASRSPNHADSSYVPTSRTTVRTGLPPNRSVPDVGPVG